MSNINMELDQEFARRLQEEYDREEAFQLQNQIAEETNNKGIDDRLQYRGDFSENGSYSNTELKTTDVSPVDQSLEYTDPNPDIRVLFLQFNTQFFWGKLSGIEVKWSPRMTLCAGLCVYEGHGGLCSVRLSLPLLKLRPRKDLIETLLHEMIHAYLFVTDNDRDHDGHGPQFHKHMHRINKATGANISIYHTFHDEVASYQQHWWRCDGPCRNRKPYFGYVKRAMNRAPSSRDFWWAEHQASCGGTYTKIKEPEGYGQKKGGKKEKEGKSKDIRTFTGKGHVLGSVSKSSSNEIKKNVPVIGSSKNPATIFNVKNSGILSASTSSNLQSSIIVNGILQKAPVKTRSFLFSEVKRTNVLSTVDSNSTIHGNKKPHSSPSGDPSKSETCSKPKTGLCPVDDDDDLCLPDKKYFKGKVPASVNDRNKINDSFKIKTHNDGFNSRSKKSGFSFIYKDRNNKPSVCKGGVFYKDKTKKRKKYILDELDSNDHLWDTESISSVIKKEIKSESNCSLKTKLKECHENNNQNKLVPKINISVLKTKQLSSSQMNIGRFFSSSGHKSKGSSSSASDTSESKLKVKNANMVKTEQLKLNNNEEDIFRASDHKRSEAFSSEIVDISDGEDNESYYPPSKMNVSKSSASQRVKSKKTSPTQTAISSFCSSSDSKVSSNRKSLLSKFRSSISGSNHVNQIKSDVLQKSKPVKISNDEEIDFTANDRKNSYDDSVVHDIVDLSEDDHEEINDPLFKKNVLSKINTTQHFEFKKTSLTKPNISSYLASSGNTCHRKRKLLFSDIKNNSSSSDIHKNRSYKEKQLEESYQNFTNDPGSTSTSGYKRSPCEAFVSDFEDDDQPCYAASKKSKGITNSSFGSNTNSLGEQHKEHNTAISDDIVDHHDESVAEGQVTCPACGVFVPEVDINTHLDLCLC